MKRSYNPFYLHAKNGVLRESTRVVRRTIEDSTRWAAQCLDAGCQYVEMVQNPGGRAETKHVMDRNRRFWRKVK